MDFKPKLFILSPGIAKIKHLADFFPEFELQFLPFFYWKAVKEIKAQVTTQLVHAAATTSDNTPKSFDTNINSVTQHSSAHLDDLASFNPCSALATPLNVPFAIPTFSIATWGKKPTTRKAEKLAQYYCAPLVRLEDGFLRSVAPASKQPLSLILDRTGIYYDATRASDLEFLIAQPLSEKQSIRAQAIGEQWCQARVSKYNHSPDISEAQLQLLTEGRPFLLLVDQTVGDASVIYGQASVHSFEQMLNQALHHPDSPQVLIKLHPEVVSGKKRGYLSELIEQTRFAQFPQVKVIDWDVHLPSLLTQALALYTVTSQSGFEGLLHGTTVHTFGMPFYAGWGVTIDALPAPARRSSATLEQLIYSALVTYSRYIDPHTGTLTDAESTIAYLQLQREQLWRFEGTIVAQGFSSRKLKHLKRFVQKAQQNSTQPSNTDIQKIIFRWGACTPLSPDSPPEKSSQSTKTHQDSPYIQVEDGFIRSLGLGALLRTPYSWVFDQSGMYYDATRPSDLEHFLQHHEFTEAQTTRAAHLQTLLIELGITKYNLDSKLVRTQHTDDPFLQSLETARKDQRPITLVIGQVETDASIALGGMDIKTNWDLVQAVREQFPTAYLIYKPHPDVQAGLRRGKQDHAHIRNLCDFFATDYSLPELMEHVDALHTISSLSGFEALLRSIPVYCYGMPFYAGWGLTNDRHTCPRRTRKLTLAQLIYGALIDYPTYLHPITGAYCTPEDLCIALDQQRIERTKWDTTKSSIVQGISQYLTWRAMQIYHRLKGL